MITLPRLGTSLGAIVNAAGVATKTFSRLWDSLCRTLEGANEAISSQLSTIQRIAQSVSFTENLTLTAAATSVDTTISISAHTRIYLDVPAVSVDAGTITGVPFATAALVYYDDPTRVGGLVTYAYTTDPNSAATSNANPGRVYVGQITTPSTAGDPPSHGAIPVPPGHASP